jgi:uncharacterized membrane protein
MAGLVAGTIWAALALVSWEQEKTSATDEQLWLIGLVCFVIGAAIGGYAVVPRAPVWLRGIVTGGAGLLGYGVVTSLLEALDKEATVAGALALPVILASLAALIGGGSDEPKEPRHQGGHRAAR